MEYEPTTNDARNTFRAVSLFRPLFAGLSLRKPRFDSRLVHVGFVVHKVALRQVLLSASVFPCHYYSTSAPYYFIHLSTMLFNLAVEGLVKYT